MKIKLIFQLVAILALSSKLFGQVIFENKINGINPSSKNPYLIGQTFDDNITVLGIGRGIGVSPNTGDDRYNAKVWNSTKFDDKDYFEFKITPKSGYKIDFVNFTYKAQVSGAGPKFFAFRSSVDGFIANITSPSIPNSDSQANPVPIVLSESSFQNCSTEIVFRFYGWGGSSTNGTFSINEFAFNGVVSCATLAPTIKTIVQPNCIANGSIELNNLPDNFEWDLYQNDVLILKGAAGNSTIISELTEGNYHYSVFDGRCRSVASVDVVINAAVTNTWSDVGWSLGSSPTSLNDKIVFASDYPPTVDPNIDIIGCSCLVSGNKNVIIKEGRTLKIENGIEVQGTGTLTFENNASLLQINDQVVNTGNISYKRKTTPIDKFDYTYWSSPVKNQTLLAVSPNTLQDKFYSFNPAINNWKQENPSNFMELGKGYIIRGPQDYITQTENSTYEANFIGVPNNGTIESAIGITSSFNLIGNPYPSALDADSFLLENKDLLAGTIYLWTHNTDIAKNNPNPGPDMYAYSSDDYASYNLTGGVGTRAQSSSSSGAVNNNVPSGKIAAGQAFFAKSMEAGNVVFRNDMRVGVPGVSGDNSQFFKFKKAPNTEAVIEKNRVWLNLSNNQAAFKQTLIGYITAATNDYDRMFDGESFDANDYVDFYSICQDKKLVIQGKALPFDPSDTIQVGYSVDFSGSLTIDIDQVEGELVNHNIFIEDKEHHIIHNLTLSPYNFTTEKGVFNDRFVLRYTDNKLNNTDFEITGGDQVLISSKNKQISITSLGGLIDKIIIFDTTAKRLYEKVNVESQELKILNLISQQQVLFVKVVLADGASFVKKIIY
jgi:hypothetical protein